MIKKDNNFNVNPQRQAFTARQHHSHRKKINLDGLEMVEMGDSLLQNYVRPKTTALIKRVNHSTINTSGRNSNMINLRSISVIQNEMSDRFKQQLSPFLKNRFKHFVKKKHEQHILHRYYNNTLQNTQLQNTSKMSNKLQLDNYYTLINGDKLQIQRQVDQVYLNSAKQKISRLIDMKKEKESDYQTLSVKIKAKRTMIEEIKKKNRFNQFKKQTIQQQQWDKNWLKTKKNQEKRYRNRLIMKCNKKNIPFFDIAN